VENASLLRKSNLAVQLARKFEGENKKLLEKANYLSKEVLAARKPATRKLHEEFHSSPNTCTDISEIVSYHPDLQFRWHVIDVMAVPPARLKL
jgi:hypothetical protein